MKKLILVLVCVCAASLIYAQHTQCFGKKDTLYVPYRAELLVLKKVGSYTKVQIADVVSSRTPDSFWMLTQDIAILQQEISERAMHVVTCATKLWEYYPAPPDPD